MVHRVHPLRLLNAALRHLGRLCHTWGLFVPVPSDWTHFPGVLLPGELWRRANDLSVQIQHDGQAGSPF